MGFLYDDYGRDEGLYSLFSGAFTQRWGGVGYHLANLIEAHPKRFWMWIFAEGRGGDQDCRPCYTRPFEEGSRRSLGGLHAVPPAGRLP